MARFLDALLGPHCPHLCGERVYPKDLHGHLQLEHAGDPTISVLLRDAVKDKYNAAAYLRRHRRTTIRKRAAS